MLLPINFLKGISVPQIPKAIFEFTINTVNVSTGSTANNQFRIPLISGSIVDFIVDWGDGTTNTINYWDDPVLTHTYSTPGIYTIKAKGVFRGLRFNNTGDRNKIINISKFGSQFYLIAIGQTFRGCNNLDITATDTPIIEGGTSLSACFDGCFSLTTPNLNDWNTSAITNMVSVFRSCNKFNGNISNWDTSNVTNMQAMFQGCTSFNQSLENWNVSKVTTMRTMFYSCYKFNQPLNNWNTGLVTNMQDIFYSCYEFNQPLNNWNTSNVITMQGMFNNTWAFNQNINTWNTSNVTTMVTMFSSAELFNQPLNNWNTGKVTNMYAMFNGATSFNQPLDNWNTSLVTNMSELFQSAESFNQPLNSWNTSNVSNMSNMFAGAIAFNQPLNNWNTSNVYEAISMFQSAISFNQNIGSWDTSVLSDVNNMFQDATAFNNGGSPDIGNWYIYGNKYWVFSGATSFNQPLTNWSLDDADNATSMFEGATSFNQSINSLVPNYWGGYTDMTNFLDGATSFSSANLDAYYNACLDFYINNNTGTSAYFSAANTQYTSAGVAARNTLINDYGWTIIDGGQV